MIDAQHLHAIVPDSIGNDGGRPRHHEFARAGHASGALAEEAGMRVFLNKREKVFDGIDLRVWLIAVPLKISPLPENFPISFALVVSRLGDGVFQNLAFVFPMGTDFENLDALPLRPERAIEPRANMRWLTPMLD